ncbi:class I SAM-dependent methyltransferase [Methylibium sp.]|uniref:class I SAM-dependent methyltransferase n=1 Tax=Methylibium sp. TaxID=2067992 RepID=UPI003D10E1D0
MPALHRLWPLPALLGWAAAWAAFALLQSTAAPLWLAIGCGTAIGVALGAWGRTRMRSLLVAVGFPVSLLASGAAASLPGWAWLLPLGLLLLVYPLHTWRDAPLFPTPARALDGLGTLAPLPTGATVLDAGCGLGAGLEALRRAYPSARLEGVEWSWPLALAASLRCRLAPIRATVRRRDMWADDWRACSMVYLFQRPESLPRAVTKARSELTDGAWLASLEFEAPDIAPQAVLRCADGRAVWLYRMPFVAAGESPRRGSRSSRNSTRSKRR